MMSGLSQQRRFCRWSAWWLSRRGRLPWTLSAPCGSCCWTLMTSAYPQVAYDYSSLHIVMTRFCALSQMYVRGNFDVLSHPRSQM